MPHSISPRDVASAGSGQILRALRNARLRPATFLSAAGRSAGGLAVGVDLCRHGRRHIESVLAECRRSLEASVPVNLTISQAGAGDRPQAELQRIGEAILSGIDGQLLASGQFGMTLHSIERPLDAYRLISRLLPPQVPRYLLLDNHSQPGSAATPENADDIWSFAWRRHGSCSPLQVVYAAQVRTACPLLADEPAHAVLPAGGMVVPAASAWLPVELYLPDFSDGHGQLQWPQLQRALHLCVDLGNSLLDTLAWTGGQQAQDARINRRLAISPGGIGDLVAERGCAPGELSCLKQLCDDIARLRQCLWARSTELARCDEPVPALQQCDPSAPWHDLPHRQAWQQKWSAALQSAAVRNRNLLLLSPYGVLPRRNAATFDYADLLPLLKFADAWSFADAPNLEHWKASEFSGFHRRASAIIRRQNAASFIADGV